MTKSAELDGPEPAPQGARPSGAAGRIARGLAANFAGNGITLLIQFVSVPIFLTAWGVPAYGEWLVLSAVPTYLALSDLSFSSVAGNSMVMLVAQGRSADAVRLGRRLWSIVTVMTGLAVLAAVAIALVFGSAFGSGAAIPASEAQIVLVALFLQVAVGTQYGVLDAWYRAGERYPTGATLRQIGRLLEFGALMSAILLGGSPATAAIAFLAGSVAGFGVSWVVLRRVVPWSTFRLDRPHLQTFRELWAPGLAYMAFPIASAMSLQGFTIVVGYVLGAPAVVVFSATRTVTRGALLIVFSVTASIFPELSRSVGGGSFQEARTILRGAVRVSVLSSAAISAVLVFLGPTIIRWWTHGNVDPPWEVLWPLLLVVVLDSLWLTLSAVITATNRHRRLAVVSLLVNGVALGAALPLSYALGLPGAALALLSIEVSMLVFVVPQALRIVHEVPRNFLRALLDVPGALRWVTSRLRSPA